MQRPSKDNHVPTMKENNHQKKLKIHLLDTSSKAGKTTFVRIGIERTLDERIMVAFSVVLTQDVGKHIEHEEGEKLRILILRGGGKTS